MTDHTFNFTTVQYPGAHDTAFGVFGIHAINNAGVGIGSYDTNSDNGFSGSHAFLYNSNNGAFSPPIDAPGVTRTFGVAINDAGTALVQGDNGGGTQFSFTYQNGGFAQIAFPSAVQTQALDINNRGQIIGQYLLPNGSFQSFIDTNGRFTTIKTPDEQPVNAVSINNLGEVVGFYGSHGFTYLNGKFQKIDFPGAASTSAFNLNDRGDVIGTYVDTNGVTNGFIDAGGKFSTIDSSDAFPLDINNAGKVVGTTPANVFLYDNGNFQTVAGIPGTINNIAGINNRGDIIGTSVYSDSSGGNGLQGFIGTDPANLLPAVVGTPNLGSPLPDQPPAFPVVSALSPESNVPILPPSNSSV